MKNIHVLKTDKPSRLWVNNLKRRLEFEKDDLIGSNTAKHIYITSDEEIKEGDWFYDDLAIPDSMKVKYLKSNLKSDKKLWLKRKKIILTTDQDLIADGVQAIDNEFLEWFVKNPSCEWIGLQRGFADGTDYGYNFLDYKIIIPKEEPKQLTPESFIQDIATHLGKTIPETLKHIEDFSKELDKLKEEPKQERMYSEEEVIKAIGAARVFYKTDENDGYDEFKHTPIEIIHSLKQFKK